MPRERLVGECMHRLIQSVITAPVWAVIIDNGANAVDSE